MTHVARHRPTPATRARHAREGLAIIAAFKFVKSAALIAAGLGILGLLRASFADRVEEWLEPMSLGRTFMGEVAAHALTLLYTEGPRRLTMLAVGAFLYAGVFLVEGIGLARGRRWGEYLTIGVTLSFLPFEVIAVFHHTTWLRVGTLLVNVAVVIYLVWQLRSSRDDEAA
jgi:uncharacterized membrane protein (DUF2068 family)